MMGDSHWEHFEHKADIGVRGYGSTMAEAFEQAALAMTSVITDLSLVEPLVSISIECRDDDDDALLFDWLNALIYEMATRKMLFCSYEVTIADGRLDARVAGEAIDIDRHQPSGEVKGATYTELAVTKKDRHWLAQCVIDV